MICNKCRNTIPNESNFCQYCGTEVHVEKQNICKKCGVEYPDDSVFCPYCGDKINRIDRHTIQSTQFGYVPNMFSKHQKPEAASNEVIEKDGPDKLKRFCIAACIVLAALAVVVICVVNSDSNSYSKVTDNQAEELTYVAEPTSGAVIFGQHGDSYIQVKTSSQACLVKLKDIYGNDKMAFYVRANETAKVAVPTEYMYVYFASGDTWYGYDKLFGENTYYSKDDTGIDFSQYMMEYTLYPVTNGNFRETPINESEF